VECTRCCQCRASAAPPGTGRRGRKERHDVECCERRASPSAPPSALQSPRLPAWHILPASPPRAPKTPTGRPRLPPLMCSIITCVCFLFSSCGGKYPGGGYMTLELFFVSARTSKRHHHLPASPPRAPKTPTGRPRLPPLMCSVSDL
jgi:hypothetical protein